MGRIKYYRYVVLYGQQGVSREIRTKGEAMKVAKFVKKKYPGKRVSVDRVTVYPRARRGQTDWSQTEVARIKSQRRKKKARKIRRRR